MPSTIHLYDLARRDQPNTCWSYNVWKTRLALNYKHLPYTTIWTNHTTLGPTLQALGVPANTSGGIEYTVPTIQLTDGSVITDSAAIVKVLEDLQPSPSLELDAELEATVEKAVFLAAMPLFAVYMPRIAREVIAESTISAFKASREQRFGMTLEQMEETRGGEQAWKAAEPGFEAVKKVLMENKRDEGPFVRGSRMCYADFLIVAWFEATKRVGVDMFERVLGWDEDGRFGELYEASREWTGNDR